MLLGKGENVIQTEIPSISSAVTIARIIGYALGKTCLEPLCSKEEIDFACEHFLLLEPEEREELYATLLRR